MYESPAQKILNRKHWIKTYEKRIVKYKALYKGPLLEAKLIALNHKIKLWKDNIRYFKAALRQETSSKGANRIKNEKILLEFIAKAKIYFFIEKEPLIGKGKARRLANICMCKYTLENGLGGAYAYKKLGATRHTLYYYRDLYNAARHGAAYRFFKKALL